MKVWYLDRDLKIPEEISVRDKTLAEILFLHQRWCINHNEGQQATIENADLSCAKLLGSNFYNTVLSKVNLSGANFFRANISRAIFSKVNLEYAELRKAILALANFSNSNLLGTDLRDANCEDADFSNCNLSKANITFAYLSGVNLSYCNLINTNFRGANLSYARLTGAIIKDTVFLDCNLYGIQCDFIYLDENKKNRYPERRKFKEGEFEHLFGSRSIETNLEIENQVDEKLIQSNNRKLPFDSENILLKLFVEITGKEDVSDYIRPLSYNGLVDVYGHFYRKASTSFATALWLVDHAGVFLRAIKTVSKKDGISKIDDPIELSRVIINALTNEIGLPNDEKARLISLLLIEIGISLQVNMEHWENKTIQQFIAFAKRASLSTSENGYERFILPWAFQIEQMDNLLPLPDRIASLQQEISRNTESSNVTELELNNWAYFLLRIGRWKSATPMARLATQMARIPRNLDTLGWAYYFEREINLSIETLSEALEKLQKDSLEINQFDNHTSKEPKVLLEFDNQIFDKKNYHLENWTEVAYHKFYVLLHANRKTAALELLQKMLDTAPDFFWTNKAKNLEILLQASSELSSRKTKKLNQAFEYDVALSFAGDDRRYAEELATALHQHGVIIFYDEFEKSELWGKNLYDYFADLYQNKARYCVMFISKHYATNRWTNLEREAAQARALREDCEYILPIRLDNTEIPGLLSTVGYLNWNKEGMDEIIKCILGKLKTEIKGQCKNSKPNIFQGT